MGILVQPNRPLKYAQYYNSTYISGVSSIAHLAPASGIADAVSGVPAGDPGSEARGAQQDTDILSS